ncbi:MAG TPA: purine-nucleoside phosphorylase [Candidatus Cloacimonadota bacterium]|nr:purine-nucleoside phosphorylase [Candidatus Cloacimonadota bacterium]HPS39395.1 purine-nucleoside phosphorylase [Candidatus Cloacimonadota bacterium]
MSYTETAAWLRERLPQIPETAIILGTGLSDLADHYPILFQLPYAQIPGFMISTAPSHKGNLLICEIGAKPVLMLQGRFHYYEGYPMSDVVFPTRVLAKLGVKNLIVTNAAGSLRENLAPGAIVQITDHINFMGTNPLIGHNDDELGERFPSMNRQYDPEYIDICARIAANNGIRIERGTYISVTGPSLETKAECAFFAQIGADLVGMSTVPEVIAARHCGLRVLAFSIVTNYSNLFHDLAHSQEEIRDNAGKAAAGLRRIVEEFISQT